MEAAKMQIVERDNKGQPCGLGACEVRTCLWGNVWVRVSVAGVRIQVSLPLSPHLRGPSCSQWLPCLEVTPRGVGNPQVSQSHWLVLVLLFFPSLWKAQVVLWSCCRAPPVHVLPQVLQRAGVSLNKESTSHDHILGLL